LIFLNNNLKLILALYIILTWSFSYLWGSFLSVLLWSVDILYVFAMWHAYNRRSCCINSFLGVSFMPKAGISAMGFMGPPECCLAWSGFLWCERQCISRENRGLIFCLSQKTLQRKIYRPEEVAIAGFWCNSARFQIIMYIYFQISK